MKFNNQYSIPITISSLKVKALYLETISTFEEIDKKIELNENVIFFLILES